MHISFTELLVRFLVGGAVVSFFAVLAEVFRPKSFAGLFGAAPSVALATLGITIARHGKAYAAVEAQFMVYGALAFCCYALVVSWILTRYKPPALTATISLLPLWFAASFALWFVAR
jgi:hydrogenase-4 membrane subunit HyfE